MLDKGFAVQDEGTYVLSYRFWDTNPYFVSGSQYFYGPIFEALGESIPLLRLLRLTMVIGANAWFGWTFLVWLSHERDEALPSSRTSLVLLLTAAGGMSYLWTPLTPGYYDLTADASLVLVSLLLLTLVHAPRVPSWIPLAMGVAAVVLVVTKWTAVTVLVLTLGVAAWALLRHARRAAVRYAVLVAVGAASALVVCQLFLMPARTVRNGHAGGLAAHHRRQPQLHLPRHAQRRQHGVLASRRRRDRTAAARRAHRRAGHGPAWPRDGGAALAARLAPC